jgi:peptidoglycan/xylan/chitin deacetylase (PgdA/CDA1 family)
VRVAGAKARDVPQPKPAYVKLGLQAIRRTQAWHAGRRDRGPLWESGIRIFCYHRIAADRGDLAVDPADFRRHIELLRSFDAEVVPLADAPRLLAASPGGRLVCLTFDDGYRDFEDEALPVLREAGFPVTVFVTTGFASGSARMSWFRQPPPVLGWPDLERLAADELVALGAHTRTHPALTTLPDDEARDEIEAPRREIEVRTGAVVTAFAYPAGLFSPRDCDLVEAGGYSVAVTTDPGVNLPEQSPFALRRTVVEGRDGVSLFEAKLLGRLDVPWELRHLFRARVAR